MKRAVLAFFTMGVLAVVSGCTTEPVCCQRHGGLSERAADGCGCGRPGCPHCGHRGQEASDPGPPTGAITYPYYTLRGPRDFFQRTPSPIGP